MLSTDHHFVGGGFEVGMGLRYRFSKWFAISSAVEYQYKGHEANSWLAPRRPTNDKYTYHLLVVPFDISYTFKHKLGIHLGAELIKMLAPSYEDKVFAYQTKPWVAALVGVSYTYKRFRFELFYKHHLAYYTRTTIPFYIGTNEPDIIVSHYTHWHDIQLRIAVRLFTIK